MYFKFSSNESLCTGQLLTNVTVTLILFMLARPTVKKNPVFFEFPKEKGNHVMF